uniref:Mitochondrial fission process protein 1 n=1 Tax=Gopherus agassizii TaxID=38772 RepID=A0A452HT58_9SAUR
GGCAMGPPAETDLYRDTWVRYLGYANEVGESFRAIVPISLVWASYGVATTYVMADAIDKGKKAAVIFTPVPLMAPSGIELTTLGLVGQCSNP